MAVARDYLGKKLKDLRKQRGITGRELASIINYSQAGISKVERGVIKPTVELVEAIARALKLSRASQRALVDETKLFLDEFNRWAVHSISSVPDSQRIVGQREARAKIYKHYAMNVVPGLLQTSTYMEAILTSLNRLSRAEIHTTMELRLARQKVLHKRNRVFHFLIDQRALVPTFCDAQVMRGQIERLRELSALTNVSIKILPLGGRYAACPVTTFVIYDDLLASVELLTHEFNVWTESEVREYVNVFSGLEASALSNRDSLALLNNLKQ